MLPTLCEAPHRRLLGLRRCSALWIVHNLLEQGPRHDYCKIEEVLTPTASENTRRLFNGHFWPELGDSIAQSVMLVVHVQASQPNDRVEADLETA